MQLRRESFIRGNWCSFCTGCFRSFNFNVRDGIGGGGWERSLREAALPPERVVLSDNVDTQRAFDGIIRYFRQRKHFALLRPG